VFGSPQHPYTQALLRAAPVLEPGRRSTAAALGGELPSPLRPIAGCPFHTRCPAVFERCRTEAPVLRVRHGHAAACHLVPLPA
jgi:oligopeptide/dipeptide ABC transporter ATP-binding protein